MSQDKNLRVLQASLDVLHSHVTKIYGALATLKVDDRKERAKMKREIEVIWSGTYDEAKKDAAKAR